MIDYLENLEPAAIRAVICNDPSEVLSDLELAAASLPRNIKVAGCRVAHVPTLNQLLDQMTGALAEIVKAIYPNWYDFDHRKTSSRPTAGSICELDIDGITAEMPKVLGKWLQASLSCCRKDEIPLLRQFSAETNAVQLSLAIGAQKLILVISIEDIHPQSENLLGLAKAAEWFARVTGSAVCVLVPQVLSKRNELESILYDSIQFAVETKDRAGGLRPCETKYAFFPIQGSPHPFSPGEQALAKQLTTDPELGGLFIFNEKVDTIRGTKYVVDLLWPDGKVVVEVDGYGIHGSRFAFGQDRNRDYELVISGYLVLRLTDDEVLGDVAIALDKIRDVVNYRKNNPILNKEARS